MAALPAFMLQKATMSMSYVVVATQSTRKDTLLLWFFSYISRCFDFSIQTRRSAFECAHMFCRYIVDYHF